MGRQLGDGAVVVDHPMAYLLRGQRREKYVGREGRFGCRTGLEQEVAMPMPEGVGSGVQSRPGRRGLGHQDKIEMAHNIGQVLLDEGSQAFGGFGSWAKRSRTAEDRALQLLLPLIEQRDGQAALVDEAAVERSFADAGSRCDVVHRDASNSALGEEALGSGEHASAIAGRIRAFMDHPTADDGELVPSIRRRAASTG